MRYAGIGARETPTEVLHWMSQIGAYLGRRDYLLRSGGATGADSAFFKGCESVKGAREVFLPWRGYNDVPLYLQRIQHGKEAVLRGDFAAPTEAAMALAAKFHPNWNSCSPGARKLHARNSHILLGLNLDEPVDFVICWTKGAKGEGGTGQALRVARAHRIPIYDLASIDARNRLRAFLKGKE